MNATSNLDKEPNDIVFDMSDISTRPESDDYVRVNEWGPEDNSKEDPIDKILKGMSPDAVDEYSIEGLIDKHPEVEEVTAILKSKRDTRTLTEEQELEYVAKIKANRQEVSNLIRERLGI